MLGWDGCQGRETGEISKTKKASFPGLPRHDTSREIHPGEFILQYSWLNNATEGGTRSQGCPAPEKVPVNLDYKDAR